MTALSKRATVLALGLLVLFAQAGGQAQTTPPDALPYSTGYLVTGDYVVGTVDLNPRNGPVNGLLGGTIPMSGVPANADILAAFLYWEMISPQVAPAVVGGAKFRGQPITSVRVKSTAKPLTGNVSSCFASGTGLTLTMFRADVLPLLPPQKDGGGTGTPTGKLLVNDADLIANGQPLHSVALPSVNGNGTPQSAGATLFVVYRDSSKPLKKIVVYDGLYIQAAGTTMSQKIRGFYGSPATTKSAKITYLAGSGAPNKTDREWFNNLQTSTNTLLATNAFQSTDSPSSDRAWSTVTFDVSSMMPGKDLGDGYGETVQTLVDHSNTSPYDCFAFAAIMFSTNVKDVEHDGLPDVLEDAASPLKDPNGQTLPDLHAMGATSSKRDIFIEVNAMRTTSPKTYGSASAPYDPTADPPLTSVTAPPHNHLPTPEVIRLVGEAFKNAPNTIAAHFDVGDIGAYHALGADYSSAEADAYLVPSSQAKGGELVDETACSASVPTCRFPDYPGTIGWGFSLQKQMLSTFDKNRNGFFHYIFYGHSRGRAKSDDAESPGFHVPTTSSGVADLPGSKALVTLGRWDNFVGTPLIRATTTLHELGHNLELWHGGAPPTFTKNANGTIKSRNIEPNCKPDYISVMSYLFQLRGLLDNGGATFADFSSAVNGPLNENTLTDAAISNLKYRAAWYQPLVAPSSGQPGSLAYVLGLPKAKKFCNGTPFPANAPADVARIDALSVGGAIDWNGLASASPILDINFDGSLQNGLAGFNDWANIHLDQTGGGHVMGDVSNGGQDFGGQDFGGQDFGGQDFGGQDFGGQDFGGQDFGGQDFGGLDIDGQDFGGQDFGGQDFGGDGEVDYETAKAIASAPPNNLTACVIGGNPSGAAGSPGTPACGTGAPATPLHRTYLTWKAPTVGTPQTYLVYRVTGATVTNTSTPVLVCNTPTQPNPARPACPDGSTTTFVDTEELPHGQPFTYYVQAIFTDTSKSGASNFASINARNDAPIAIADALTTNEDHAVSGNVLLANPGALDSDADSTVRIPFLATLPAHGSLGTAGVLTDGSFTYTPAADFYGVDTFTYKLLKGAWPPDPSVPLSERDSDVVRVDIVVNPVNDPPSFTKGADQTAAEDSGLHTVPVWVTAISVGPANESNGGCLPLVGSVCQQTVSFVVTTPDTALFSGQPAIVADGTLTFTPKANANGVATVTVVAKDTGGVANGGIDTSAAQTFTITITPVNDAPIAHGPSVTAIADTDTPITLGGEDIETAALSLTFNTPATTDHGTLTGTGPNLTYKSAANYSGPDSFTFTVTDRGDPDDCGAGPVPPQGCAAAATSTTATVTITVVPKNTALAVARQSETSTTGEIHTVNLDTRTITSTVVLPGNPLDVAVTPDHNTALVTGFNDQRVTFLDLTASPPTVLGTLPAPIFAEDVDIDAAGNYAVIADGGGSTKVFSVNIASRQIVSTLTLPSSAEGITFVPNRPIVLANAFTAGVVRVLAIGPTGILTDNGITVSVAAGAINVTPSPDGSLALVPNLSAGAVHILRISATGSVTSGGTVAPASGQDFSGAQSVAFTPDGSRAYLTMTTGAIALLNVDLPTGTVTDSGIRLAGTASPLGYYGVDKVAVTGNGQYVAVHGAGFVTIIDPVTNSIVGTIAIPNDASAGGIASIR